MAIWGSCPERGRCENPHLLRQGPSPQPPRLHSRLAGSFNDWSRSIGTLGRDHPVRAPRFNFRGADVVDVLERVCRAIGFPAAIRVDQGSEFVSRDLDLWAYQRGVTLDFSRPGKPTDNAFIESFNGKFRAECLNAHWFMSLDDGRRKCEAWRRDYNEDRPHSSIGNKAPIELVNRSAALGPP